MHKRHKLEGIVLSSKKIGEADRLVTLFTRDQGLVRAIAKGVRRIPSNRGGHLETLTRVVTIVSESRAGTYLGSIETQEYYDDLHSREDSLRHAHTIALSIRYLLHELEAQAGVYDAFEQALQNLPRLPAVKQALLEAKVCLHVLQAAGLMPDLAACVSCRIERPSEAVILSAHEGGWHCLLCHRSLQGADRSFSPRVLAVLRFVVKRPREALRLALQEEEGRQLLGALRGFIHETALVPAGLPAGQAGMIE